MRRWLLLLGGPMTWAVHFGLVYAIASISVQATDATVPLARTLIVGSGLIGAAVCGVLVWISARMRGEDGFDQFSRIVAAAGAIVSGIAILWQSLPALAPI